MRRLSIVRDQQLQLAESLTPRAALLVVVTLYVTLRLPYLYSLPLFNDEAVYLVRALYFPAMMPLTLADGKLLQELILVPLVRLPGDPLLYARLLSLASGLGTILIFARIGDLLCRPGAGVVAGLIYTAAPVAILHDRLGLPDSMLTTAASLTLLVSLRFALSDSVTRRDAVHLGLCLAADCLIKLPGLFLFGLPVLAVLILVPGKTERRRRLALLRLALITALLVLASLAPAHYGGAESQKAVGGTLLDRVKLPLYNFADEAIWAVPYLPAPLLLSVVVVLLQRKSSAVRPILVYLLSAGVMWGVTFALIGRQVYPRYLLPGFAVLWFACGLAIAELCRLGRWPAKTLGVVGLAATLVWGGFFAVTLMVEPQRAPLVDWDRRQYLERWTAGHNIPAILALLREQAQASDGSILVNHDQPRLIHLASMIYLKNACSIALETIDLREQGAAERLQALADKRPTFMLADHEELQALQLAERFPWLEVVRRFDHPTGKASFYLYRVPAVASRQGQGDYAQRFCKEE